MFLFFFFFITGRYLLDHKNGYNCRFGNVIVPAIAEHVEYQLHNVVVDELLTCVTPPHATGRKVRFQIEHADVNLEGMC